MVVIDRFAQIANDSIFERAVPGSLIRVCGNENRRDRVPGIDQMLVELDPGHSRHLDVGDQAGDFGKMGRGQKIGCRRERFNPVPERIHQLSHRFAKRLIVLDDRYQHRFRHRGSLAASQAHPAGASALRRAA
jgi:hypothetical protein